MKDTIRWSPKWTVEKFINDDAFAKGESYEKSEFEGNLLLNAGITELLNLLCTQGSPTAYSNAAAYIGVGDSTTAAQATDTGLLAATNKLWKAMETSFPAVANQTASWKSSFASGEANYAWNEFTIVNASSDTGVNLNRKVSAQGTKTSGQVWTVTLTITIS